MILPDYSCTLNINTIKLLREEGVNAICDCQIIGNGELQIQYFENENQISSLHDISEDEIITLENVGRNSKLRLYTMVTEETISNGGGLKCNITILSSDRETNSYQ